MSGFFSLKYIIPPLVIAEISSIAEQAGLSLNWSQTPETGFLVTRLICFEDTSWTGISFAHEIIAFKSSF